MAFHVNPTTGNASPCVARVKCPFGDLEKDHYGSADEARASFEAKMGSLSVLSSQAGHRPGQWRPSAEEIDAVRNAALNVAAAMDADPDELPPVDDPAIPYSVEMDEEEGYITSMAAFKDPAVARNNCIIVAESVMFFTERKYGYVDEEAAGPYLNIHAANTYTDDLGREWVIDYTYSQVDPNAEWPHVDSLAYWRNNIRQTAGSTPF